MDKVKKWISENVVIVVLILLCIGFGVGNPTFITPQNIINVLSQMCINALLASGLVYVIILGGIDISVGSVVGLSGVCAALVGLKFFPNMGIPTALAVLVLAGRVMGAIIGGFNGLMIAKFKVVPMIATLAMLSIARGLAYIVSGGQPVYGLPNSFAFLGANRLIKTEGMPNGIIPVGVIFTIIIVAIMHIILSKTVFGRHVYACGSNPNVAHLSGINVPKVTLICHMLCGITAAMGGVLMASKLQNGQPAGGDAYEMYAIASTVLGGTSLTGGSGSVARAMFGAAVIAVINNGMNLMQISSYWQKVVIGIIILLAVILDMAQQNKGKN